MRNKDGSIYISADNSILNAKVENVNSIYERVNDNELIGSLSTNANDNFAYEFELINGEGDEDNELFLIDGDDLKIKSSPFGTSKDSYSVRVKAINNNDSYEKVFTFDLNKIIHKSPSDILFSNNTFEENIESGSIIST